MTDKFETKVVHAGWEPDPATGSVEASHARRLGAIRDRVLHDLRTAAELREFIGAWRRLDS